ncbi:hypothetical protein [Algoriphagus antarcticus]|uniref:Uncharacterized protein n=1 Tax=Algoriphagus antarcticus TaxID=238540 RepID=A0A3E0DPB5_9BACT|nr:hypothetical protein [Algoriphagus antarcticus]REG84797.1 hypothetical protein C8N25_114146 [Algoriphagus antarcticus]
MPLSLLTPRPSFEENPKLAKAAHNLSTLISAIEQMSIPAIQKQKINEIVTGVNNFPGPDPELLKQLKSAQKGVITLLENDLKIAPKNHYQLQWLVLGMAAFGIPLGVVFGFALGNLAFMGIGLPIGMGVGIAVGSAKDKKVMEEGRQLDWLAK